MKRWITLAILMVTALSALLLADRGYRAQLDQEDARVLAQASVDTQNRMQGAVSMRLRAIEDLQAFMLAPASLPDNDTFNRYAAGVLDHYPTISGLAFVDANRIVRYFYPLKDSEPTIGLDLKTQPAAPFVEKAIRERQVLQLVAEGKSSAEIGKIVFLSRKSVETYRSRLMKKLGVSDVPALVKFAIRHGLTPPD